MADWNWLRCQNKASTKTELIVYEQAAQSLQSKRDKKQDIRSEWSTNENEIIKGVQSINVMLLISSEFDSYLYYFYLSWRAKKKLSWNFVRNHKKLDYNSFGSVLKDARKAKSKG